MHTPAAAAQASCDRGCALQSKERWLALSLTGPAPCVMPVHAVRRCGEAEVATRLADLLPIAMLTTASSAAERRRVRPRQSLRRHGARWVARLPRLRSLIAGWLPHLLQGWGSRDATDDMFTDTQPRYGLAHVAHTRRGRALVQGLHVIGQPDKWLVAQSHQSPFATPQPRGLGKDVGG